MKNIKFYTLHLDNNLPNIENIYYIHYIGKWIDVVISRFQLTKTLKMNIRKHFTKKDRTNDSFNIWIRHDCTIASLFLSSCQNEAFYISTSYHDNKFANTQTYQYCFVRQLNKGRKYVFHSSTCRNLT